jgi:hypothetical protein
MVGDQNGAGDAAPGACPVCGEPVYGWTVVDPPGADSAPTVLDRCENCGTVVERGVTVDLDAEWRAALATAAPGGREMSVPNRGSLQAALGLDGWAALDLAPGRLLLNRRGLELLAERAGQRLESVRTPPTRRSLAWMWQTLENGLTFHANFAREWRAGRLRPSTAISGPRFWIDAVVAIIAAPLVALVAVPLELVASAFGRGGELRATAGGSPSL